MHCKLGEKHVDGRTYVSFLEVLPYISIHTRKEVILQFQRY